MSTTLFTRNLRMTCSICFEEITKETGSTILSCTHGFHYRCINHWFWKQNHENERETCPCCRSKGKELDRFFYFMYQSRCMYPTVLADTDCPICFEPIKKKTGCTTLSCGHSFHFRCINYTFWRHTTHGEPEQCPCCDSEGGELDRFFKTMPKEQEVEEEEDDYEYDSEDYNQDTVDFQANTEALIAAGWQVSHEVRPDGTIVQSISWTNPNFEADVQAQTQQETQSETQLEIQEEQQPQPQQQEAQPIDYTPEQLQAIHQEAISLYRQILSSADRQESAVRKLQAVWRGYSARKDYKTVKCILKLSQEDDSNIVAQTNE